MGNNYVDRIGSVARNSSTSGKQKRALVLKKSALYNFQQNSNSILLLLLPECKGNDNLHIRNIFRKIVLLSS